MTGVTEWRIERPVHVVSRHQQFCFLFLFFGFFFCPTPAVHPGFTRMPHNTCVVEKVNRTFGRQPSTVGNCLVDPTYLYRFQTLNSSLSLSLSLLFRITCFHLPFQSKWLYVGTERGNVHIVNIESFSLSGYIINWNKAIEL